MTSIENRLVALGEHIEWPEVEDLSKAVVARLRLQPLARPRARAWRLALAATVILAVVTLSISGTARTAVARFLEVAGVRIDFGAPTEPPPGSELRLGTEVDLVGAVAAVDFPLLVPTDPHPGTPDAIYVNDIPAGGQVTLLWEESHLFPPAPGSGVGLLISSFVGHLEGEVYAKELNESHSITEVVVRETEGYWIEGSPHVFLFEDARGNIGFESIRLAGNVLLWEENGVTIRIESGLDKDQVLAIAATLQEHSDLK